MSEMRYCPYVGLADDRETHTTYPSPRNFCHAHRPARPAPEDEQALHCLTVYHVRCERYRQACQAAAATAPAAASATENSPLPRPAPPPRRQPPRPAVAASKPSAPTNPVAKAPAAFSRKAVEDKLSAIATIGFFGLAALLMATAILAALWWQQNSQVIASPSLPILAAPLTATPTYFLPLPPTAAPTGLLAIPVLTQPAPTFTPSPALTTGGNPAVFPTDTAPPTSPTPCVRPPGWVPYTVSANDTLFGLGQRYGVSVADLQAGNCMGSRTLIRVGEVLYVPNTATQAPPQPFSPTPQPLPSETATLFFSTEPPLLTLTPLPPLSSQTPTPWPSPTASTPYP